MGSTRFRRDGGQEVVMGPEGEAVRSWRAGGERSDAELAVRGLSSDVRLISPITDRFQFVGPEQVLNLLRVALDVIQDVRYLDEVSDGSTVALFYRARVGDTALEEAQRLRLDEHGSIREITLFLRPLPGLTRLARDLGPKLAHADHRPGLAQVLNVTGRVLDGMAAAGERRLLPKAAPRQR
jgi:hypothetical protein